MSRLYTKNSKINGTGLYTNEELQPGDHVGYIHGPIAVIRHFTPAISEKILDWIGVGKYSWIDTATSEFRFINHSCDPNVAIVSRRKVEAIKPIPAKSEITMDYSLTEAEEGWEITCNCRAQNCRGRIGPIQTLPNSVYNEHKAHIPTPFKKIFLSTHKS